MHHEPGRLLRDLEVLGELRGGNALLVAGDHPDRHEPLVQRQLRVLEDRPDLDGEPLAALAALMGAIVREVVHLRAAAVRAERAILPANGPEMINADLLVREHFHHLHQAVELLDHGCTLSMQPT